jgi:hypothetical protein
MTEQELRELADLLEAAYRIVAEAVARLDGEQIEVERIDPRIVALEATEARRQEWPLLP